MCVYVLSCKISDLYSSFRSTVIVGRNGVERADTIFFTEMDSKSHETHSLSEIEKFFWKEKKAFENDGGWKLDLHDKEWGFSLPDNLLCYIFPLSLRLLLEVEVPSSDRCVVFGLTRYQFVIWKTDTIDSVISYRSSFTFFSSR